jgi:hypothetical protein
MPLSAVCRGLMGPPLKIFSPYPFAGPACGQHGVLRKDTGRTARSVIAFPIKLCRICANWRRSVRRSALGGFPPKMAWGWSDGQVRMCGAGEALVIGGICPDCQFLDRALRCAGAVRCLWTGPVEGAIRKAVPDKARTHRQTGPGFRVRSEPRRICAGTGWPHLCGRNDVTVCVLLRDAPPIARPGLASCIAAKPCHAGCGRGRMA